MLELGVILGAAVIGVGASLIMDAWNLVLKRTLGVPSLNYCLLGRWVLHMPAGTFRHARITDAAPKPLECPIGWLSHYTIGATLAIGFLVLVSRDWLVHPTLLPALLYGIGTVVFPFFVMQPAIGLGVASSKAPNPAQARLKSLVTHAVFGTGMYVTALLIRSLWGAH
jgi:hypothetical protein